MDFKHFEQSEIPSLRRRDSPASVSPIDLGKAGVILIGL